MKVLFASAEPYLPGAGGGAEHSIHALARALLAARHACEVLAGVARGGPRFRHQLARRFLGSGDRLARRDHRNGYATWRAVPREVPDAIEERLDAFRPDVVVSWNRACEEIARAAARRGVRSIVWIPDASFSWHRGVLPAPPATRVAAVSEWLAGRVRERLARPCDLLRPMVDVARYRVERRTPELVTLVNPSRAKGVDVALALAERLPSRRFLFVGSRALSKEDRAHLGGGLRRLRNVHVLSHADDMRRAYARTTVLLVPSQVEDACPRVVLEAHASGIPVVASEVGGIAEVSGGGSILLARDAPVDAWAVEVERLLADPTAARLASERALENARRSDFSEPAVLAAFLAIASSAPSPAPAA